MRGQQYRYLLSGRDAVQQGNDLLAAADVEVGQGLVQQQQPRAADQGVRDQYPLLLPAGQQPHPGISEPGRVDRVQHLGDRFAAGAGGDRDPEPVPVDPQPHQVPGPHRHVRVEEDLLRDIPDRAVPRGPGPPAHGHRPRGGPLQAQDHTRSNVVFPAPFGPIRPVNCPAPTVQLTS